MEQKKVYTMHKTEKGQLAPTSFGHLQVYMFIRKLGSPVKQLNL